MVTRAALHASLAALAGLLLVTAAVIYPAATNTDVQVNWPPLHADWLPRVSAWSVLCLVVAAAILGTWRHVCTTWSWRWVLGYAFIATWSWTMSLAFVDGPSGLSSVFERKREYLFDALQVTSIPSMLANFIDHIPIDSVDNWQTHVAGHPPGALLYFVGLVRLGITDPFWVGFTVLTMGTTAVIGGAIALRALAGESLARRTIIWWVLAPVAVWMGVNGDAFYTAVSVWGLTFLALSATAASRRVLIGFGVVAGLLLGLCVYLSYGLVLLGIPALTVLFIARQWRPLPWALAGSVVVAVIFTVAGFAWWEAFPVLRERYYDGIASERPYTYWVWGNIAAWTFTVGLATWAAFPRGALGIRRREPAALLAGAGLVCIIAATLSGMSKAEVERIWLPFTFWVLILPALLPTRWSGRLLISQVITAVTVQHLLLTRW